MTTLVAEFNNRELVGLVVVGRAMWTLAPEGFDSMKRVLILCTGNSCRSQMAEYLWRDLSAGSWEAFSAGSHPAGYVHPGSLIALEEIGIDGSGARSKHLDEFLQAEFDLVVTVCNSADNDCPVFPGAKDRAHWPFDDPGEADGTNDQRAAVFRRVRDEICHRIRAYLREEGTA